MSIPEVDMSIPKVDSLNDDQPDEITFQKLRGKVGFNIWTKRVRSYLKPEGLWYLINENEDPLEMPDPHMEYNKEVLEDIERDKKNDRIALAFIHKAISPDIFSEISYASTTREVWNLLHMKYAETKDAPIHVEEAERTTRSRGKSMANDAPILVEEAVITTKSQWKRKVQRSEGFSREQQTKPTSTDALNMDDDHGYKHTFAVILTSCEVKPNYTMSFPSEVNSFLPSKNLMANVRSARGCYKILFYGKTARKDFGMGWIQFVDEHELVEGDELKFKIIDNSDTMLDCDVHLERCNTLA